MFEPNYQLTPKIAKFLMRIEAAKQSIGDLPITPQLLATLRKTARLQTTHYSTLIEGNRLTVEEVGQLVENEEHFPGRERDEKEVLGYYAALEKVEKLAEQKSPITEKTIQILHGLVMGGGKKRIKPTPYRDGQNVIKDSATRKIVYMPPESKDVAPLMKDLISWLKTSQKEELPCPLLAAIAHYQYATIHPYYDGNGRTARLLTTLVLHLGGYDLKGLYSLEKYYAQNLASYYDALTVNVSHNYYMRRAKADITSWIEYFCEGMAKSFETVKLRATKEVKSKRSDKSSFLRKLDPRQRKALSLFQDSETISTKDISKLFNIKDRTSRNICKKWCDEDFLEMVNSSKKSRRYRLSATWESIFE